MPSIFESLPEFGEGHYKLTTLNPESGEPRLRAPLSDEEQFALLKNPKGDVNYIAQANLLRTWLEIKEHWTNCLTIQKIARQIDIPEEDWQAVFYETREGIQYLAIDLDEKNISVLFSASGKSPNEHFWMKLIGEEGEIKGYIHFHNREIAIFSNHPLMIQKSKKDIQTLSINTSSDILISEPLKAKKNIHVSGRTIKLDSQQQNTALLEADHVNLLCLDQCTITKDTDIVTGNCHIRAGNLLHQGYIESAGETHIVSELAEIHGTIAAKGEKGITIISLGTQAYRDSHLHGNSVNLLTGSPVHPVKHPLLGKLNLEGTISTKNFPAYSNDTTFDQGKTYVEGKMALAALHKMKANKLATLILNGESFYQYSEFANFVDWTVIQDEHLEIYWKNIIYSDELPVAEQLRSQLPRVLVNAPEKVEPSRRTVNFSPILSQQEDDLYKRYDKTQLIPLETKPEAQKEKSQAQIVFSAREYLSVTSDMSLTNAKVHLQAEHMELFTHIDRVSAFGSVDVFIKSNQLSVRDTVLNMGDSGQVHVEAKNMCLADSTLIAGKINIQCKQNSEIPKNSTLILKSPSPVILKCENFYLRGRMEFYELSIHAKRLVSIIRSDLKGKKLRVNAERYLAFLSKINVDELSIQSVLSANFFCIVLSTIYINTAIASLSSSLYFPSSFSLSTKSLLSCFLAATNTLISILQLMLHEPTSQLALSAVRLGINAGPALVQLYQLAKNIHEASKAPALSRGQFIQIANQAKTICLSLCSLAYSVPEMMDQFSHAPTSEVLTSPSLYNAFTGIVTPLMNTALPGVQNSNFVNVVFNGDFCFSDTTSTVANVHGGVKGSLITADSTVVDGVLPVAFDVSPVLSTKNSFCSVSAAPESILPVGSHSERTIYKVWVSAGIFPLPQYVFLSTEHMTALHGVQIFRNSSLQTNKADVTNDAAVLLEDSSLTGNHLENHGSMQYKGSQAEFKSVHNGDTAKTFSVNSHLNFGETKDDAGAVTQHVATKFQTGHLEESGLLSGDASEFNIDKAEFKKPSLVGSRLSKWKIKELEKNSDKPIFVDFHGTQMGDSKSFDFEDKSPLTVALTETGGIQYHSDQPFTIQNTDIVCAVPLGVDAPDLPVRGIVNSMVPLSLNGRQTLSTNQATLKVNGLLQMQGGKINFDGSNVQAEKTYVNGKKVTAQNGSAIIGRYGVLVESEEPLESIGKTTVITQANSHHGLFNNSKTKATETDYQNNLFASPEGNVELKSSQGTTTLQGTDVVAPKGDIAVRAKDDVNLLPTTGQNRIDKESSHFFHHKRSSDTQDTASPCHFFSGGQMLFQSQQGDIHNKGSVIDAKGPVIFDFPPDHKNDNQRLILNGSHSENSWGVNLSKVACFNVGPKHPSSMGNLPLVNALGEVNEAKGLMDTLAATTELAEESTNLANRLLKAGKKGQLSGEALKQFGLGDGLGFNPTLGWQLSISRSGVHYQILGPGSINTPLLIAHGGEADFENGYAVNAKHGIFDVDILKSSGATLKSSGYKSDTQLELSTSLTNVVDGGISHQRNIFDIEKHLASNNLNFELLDLNARKVILNGSTVTAKKLTGHVDSIESQSPLDKIHQSGYAVHASSNGSFSFGIHNENTETVAVPVAFRVNDANEFTCNDAHFVGQTAPSIHPNHSETSPLYDVSHKNSFNLSVSARDFMVDDRASDNVFTPVCYNASSQHYLARHDSNGMTVLYDAKDHFRVNVPIYHPEAGREFFGNMHWASSLLFSEHPVNPTFFTEKSRHPMLTKSLTQSSVFIDLPGCYTASRILNPSVIFSLNFNHHDTTIIRPGIMLRKLPTLSKKIEKLYRGQGGDLKEIFDDGISARGSNPELHLHAIPPGAEDYLHDSLYISATPNRKMAETFPRKLPENALSSVVAIESARPTVHIADELKHKLHEGKIELDDFETLMREQERAFVSKIFPHEIKGGWEFNIKKVQVADPENYSGWDKEAVDETCYEYHRVSVGNFIPNPHFISPHIIGGLWSSVKILGHSTTGFCLGLDVMSLFREFKHSRAINSYDNTYRKGAEIGGGWAGAWSIGTIFAEMASVACAPLPPYGEAACKISFGVAGSAIGYLGGSDAATKIYDVAKNEGQKFFHHFVSEDKPDLEEELPSLNHAAAFFKSPKWLQRSSLLSDASAQSVSKKLTYNS